MRGLKSVAALTAVALAVAASASAAPPRPFAVGSGKFGLVGVFEGSFNFSAHYQGNGTISGHILVQTEVAGVGINLYADVTCLTVTGNTAVIGGIVRNPVGLVNALVLGVGDNGEPSSTTNPDQVTALPITNVPANLCAAPVPPLAPVTQGNVVVKGG